jgi:hypothetical protein
VNVVGDNPGSIKAMARCGSCGHFRQHSPRRRRKAASCTGTRMSRRCHKSPQLPWTCVVLHGCFRTSHRCGRRLWTPSNAPNRLPKLNTRVRFPSSAPRLPAHTLFESVRPGGRSRNGPVRRDMMSSTGGRLNISGWIRENTASGKPCCTTSSEPGPKLETLYLLSQ